MKATTVDNAVPFEEALLAAVRNLPVERSQKVLEFALELQSETAQGEESLSEAEILADEKK